MTPLVFLIILISFSLLVYLAHTLYYKNNPSNPSAPNTIPENTVVLPYLTANKKLVISDNYEKGRLFENFITERFNPRYFQQLDWRSDKRHKGVSPLSSTYPDLVYQYKHRTEKVQFAVECKWRASFFDGAIQWAKSKQVENYFNFQRDKKMYVFVAIGVGGEPQEPDELFLVPLRDIHRHIHFLTRDFLEPYQRTDIHSNFFLDINKMQLI